MDACDCSVVVVVVVVVVVACGARVPEGSGCRGLLLSCGSCCPETISSPNKDCPAGRASKDETPPAPPPPKSVSFPPNRPPPPSPPAEPRPKSSAKRDAVLRRATEAKKPPPKASPSSSPRAKTPEFDGCVARPPSVPAACDGPAWHACMHVCVYACVQVSEYISARVMHGQAPTHPTPHLPQQPGPHWRLEEAARRGWTTKTRGPAATPAASPPLKSLRPPRPPPPPRMPLSGERRLEPSHHVPPRSRGSAYPSPRPPTPTHRPPGPGASTPRGGQGQPYRRPQSGPSQSRVAVAGDCTRKRVAARCSYNVCLHVCLYMYNVHIALLLHTHTHT